MHERVVHERDALIIRCCVLIEEHERVHLADVERQSLPRLWLESAARQRYVELVPCLCQKRRGVIAVGELEGRGVGRAGQCGRQAAEPVALPQTKVGKELALGLTYPAAGQGDLDVGAVIDLAFVLAGDGAAQGPLPDHGHCGFRGHAVDGRQRLADAAQAEDLLLDVFHPAGDRRHLLATASLEQAAFEFDVAGFQAFEALLQALQQRAYVRRHGLGQCRLPGDQRQQGKRAVHAHGATPVCLLVITGWLLGRRSPFAGWSRGRNRAVSFGEDQLAVAGQPELIALAGMLDHQDPSLPQQCRNAQHPRLGRRC